MGHDSWGDTFLLSACCITGTVPARPIIGVMVIMDCFILHLTRGQPKRDASPAHEELVTPSSACSSSENRSPQLSHGNAGTIPENHTGMRDSRDSSAVQSGLKDCCWSGKPARGPAARPAAPGTAAPRKDGSPTALRPRQHHRGAARPCWGHLQHGGTASSGR